MTNDEVVSLKEYIETKIEAQNQLVRELRDADKMALKIQADEYARRLDMLNHESERLKVMQQSFVSREIYDMRHEELRTQIDDLNKYKATMEGKASQNSVNVATIFGALGIMLALVAIVVDLLLRK